MLEINLKVDFAYSDGLEVEVAPHPLYSDKVKIGLGDGIEDIDVSLSTNQTINLTDKLLSNIPEEKLVDLMENLVNRIDEDLALKLTEKLIKNVYGERTLEEAEDTITSLETKLEMAEEKIDQLEEFHGIRF